MERVQSMENVSSALKNVWNARYLLSQMLRLNATNANKGLSSIQVSNAAPAVKVALFASNKIPRFVSPANQVLIEMIPAFAKCAIRPVLNVPIVYHVRHIKEEKL